jgi:hypothetical protein
MSIVQSYRNHTFHCVYEAVDEDLQKEIVAFWTKNQAIGDPEEAWRRTCEVVFVIRNATGEIAGVSSVYAGNLRDGKKYYFYRLFIQPTDRIFGMMRAVTLATAAFLRDLAIPDRPHGILHINKNIKLMKPGMRLLFRITGYVYLGKTEKGFDIWKLDFPAT